MRKALPYELVTTNLPGVYWSPAPPDDLDLNATDKAMLMRYGLLFRRPESGDRQTLQAAWNKVFSRKWLAKNRIAPELEVQFGKTHQLKGLKKPGPRRPVASPDTLARAGAVGSFKALRDPSLRP